MADKYTMDDVVEAVNGYEIEVELPDGNKARLVGTSVSGLLSTANQLYLRKQDVLVDQELDSSS